MSDNQNTIIITGAAGGIGTAFTHHFAQQQAKLMLVDLSETALGELKESVLVAGNVKEAALQTCVADVSQAEQVQKFVSQTKQAFGGVHGFLNNAGVEGTVATIADYPQDLFEQVMAVNVTGVWLGMKYVVPLMKESGGGSIVITSSVGGVMGSPGLSAYVTSKHAVIGIMRTAALECAADNIRVNTIHPGMVDTGMAARIAENTGIGVEVFEEQIKASTPLGRYAQPEDIVGIVSFLLSDASAYCTGQQYFVDGGMGAA